MAFIRPIARTPKVTMMRSPDRIVATTARRGDSPTVIWESDIIRAARKTTEPRVTKNIARVNMDEFGPIDS